MAGEAGMPAHPADVYPERANFFIHFRILKAYTDVSI
jgi:hypothetical protein